MPARIRLEPIGRYPGLRVLAWHAGLLYAGRGYALLRWRPDEDRWERCASFAPHPWRRWTSRHRLSARLVRDGYHALTGLPDGSLAAVFPGVIAILPPGSRRFRSAFDVPRGTRPLSITATPSGHLFWGEYFDNPARDAVHVYGSHDGGTSWEIVYTFAARSIRHIHSITYDAHAGCLWVLTGDEAGECRILRAAPDWSSVDVALAGSQQTRAVTVVPGPEGVHFATDTPFEKNAIYRLDRGGRLERLASIAGSSFWSCRVSRALFFSTAVEPSTVNQDPHATLYGGAGGDGWAALIRWPRDSWPSALFQYANIILPSGENDGDVLAATGLAVRGEDQVAHLWRVHADG